MVPINILGLLDTAVNLFGTGLKRSETMVDQSMADSYADLARDSRVDPLCLVSNDLKHTEYLNDVMQTSLSIVTSYYMQALPFARDISGIQVQKTLGRMNRGKQMGLESFSSLPPTISDSYRYALPTEALRAATERDDKSPVDGDVSMAVGKVIQVEVSEKVKVPVTIRLHAKIAPDPVMVAILSNETIDNSFTERYYKWRNDRITFWSEFLFASDLIKARKEIMMNDDNGILEEITKRRREALTKTASTGERSYGVSANVFIISKDILRRVESSHKGRIANANVKNTIFKSLGLLVLVVVDKEDEWVSIYYRDIDGSSDISLKALKSKVKKDSPDIGEMLKTMAQGIQPPF